MLQFKFALLINDMQNDFVLPTEADAVNDALSTVPVNQKILYLFRKTQYPVFHLVREYRYDGSDIEHTRLQSFLNTQRYALPGSYGCEIVEELQPLAGEFRIIRNRFSGFMQTELDLILRRLNVNHLVICGTQYPNCIRATAFDAICLDYHVTVITDATSAETKEIAQANILDMQNIGIQCVTLESFMNNNFNSELYFKEKFE